MKNKNTSVLNQNNIHLSQFKNEHKYQILENYWKKRKKECEKNLSKFCNLSILKPKLSNFSF